MANLLDIIETGGDIATGGILGGAIDVINGLGDLFGDMKDDQKLGIKRIQTFVTENKVTDTAWVSQAVEGAKKYSGTSQYWVWWRGKQQEYLDKIKAQNEGIDDSVFWENDGILQTSSKADAMGDTSSFIKSLIMGGVILGLGYSILKGKK